MKFDQCSAKWATESKWAVMLNGRIPAAGEIKRENIEIPMPDVQSAYFAHAKSG